jgi:hypothetical protein
MAALTCGFELGRWRTNMDPIQTIVTASTLLFGFLFAGFWWALDRELKFDEAGRHFKLSYLLLFFTMIALALFGVVMPMRAAFFRLPLDPIVYVGVGGALIGVMGFMLTEFGHYGVFQLPKYVTKSEVFFFLLTLLAMLSIFIFCVDAVWFGSSIRARLLP